MSITVLRILSQLAYSLFSPLLTAIEVEESIYKKQLRLLAISVVELKFCRKVLGALLVTF